VFQLKRDGFSWMPRVAFLFYEIVRTPRHPFLSEYLISMRPIMTKDMAKWVGLKVVNADGNTSVVCCATV
jgi:hypothetical protein